MHAETKSLTHSSNFKIFRNQTAIKVRFTLAFSLGIEFVLGQQLRGSDTTGIRTLQNECIPTSDDSFSKTAFVAINITGDDSFHVTTFDLLDLATKFHLSYNALVDCNTIPGSVLEVSSASILTDAVGPKGVVSYLLRVHVICNTCGGDGEVEIFNIPPPSSDEPDVECTCDGPFVSTFVETYNVVFFINISVANIGQLPILNCPSQDFTTFNSRGVCLQSLHHFLPNSLRSFHPNIRKLGHRVCS